MVKGKGWYNEPLRHSLARKGVKTGKKTNIGIKGIHVKKREEIRGTVITKKNLVDNIIAYENGELSDVQTLQLYSYLIKTGQVWSLQGHYGRTARNIITSGWISDKGKINWKEVDNTLGFK